MSTQTFAVTGLTCEHCVNAVHAELRALDGVTDVVVGLEPGAVSAVTVTGTEVLTDEQVAAALDEAGDYQLSEASRANDVAASPQRRTE